MIEVASPQIEVVADYDMLSKRAAEHILSRLTAQPEYSLLVPTGTTPEGVYALLSKEPQEKFDGLTIFNLDEYCVPTTDGGYTLLDQDDPRSYRTFMKQHLLGTLPNIKSHFPGIENAKQPGTYDEVIAAAGGIDLCLNTMGEDGHTFGFNFSDSSFDSVTRLVEVNESTKNVNAGLTGHDIPAYAVTTGLRTGMQSKEILVLVSGVRKADILKRVLQGDISEEVPATILRTHPNCKWIVDQAAASKL